MMEYQQFNRRCLLEAICYDNPAGGRSHNMIKVDLCSPDSEGLQVSDRGFFLLEKVEASFHSTEQTVKGITMVGMELEGRYQHI